MSKPLDRAEFLIRFTCGAVFFGLIVALTGLRVIHSINPLAVTAWVLVTLSLSFLVAVRGDNAWHRIVNLFRWWS